MSHLLLRSGPRPRKEIYKGFFGKYVSVVCGDYIWGADGPPISEVSPVAVMFQCLTAFGAAIGPSSYVNIDGKKHAGAIFTLIMGSSARARKGASLQHVTNLFTTFYESKKEMPILYGLSSGEGLINRLTEPAPGDPSIRKDRVDNELLVVLSEFGSLLNIKKREGNTLSPIIRDAWDGRTLENLTKNNPARVEKYHLGIIGHITVGELEKSLHDVDYSNGFLNRFLLVHADRQAILHDPKGVPAQLLQELQSELAELIEKSRNLGEIQMTEAALDSWAQLYKSIELREYSTDRHEEMAARGATYVRRLALLYALSDRSKVIDQEHVFSAYCAWEFCDQTCVYVFSNFRNQSKKIIRYLREGGGSATKSELFSLFGRNISAITLDAVLDFLSFNRIIFRETAPTQGRDSEVICLTGELSSITESYE